VPFCCAMSSSNAIENEVVPENGRPSDSEESLDAVDDEELNKRLKNPGVTKYIKNFTDAVQRALGVKYKGRPKPTPVRKNIDVNLRGSSASTLPNAEEEEREEGESDAPVRPEPSPNSTKKTKKRKRDAANSTEGGSGQGQVAGEQDQAEAETEDAVHDTQAAPKKKKRRTKAEIAADMLPIAPRSLVSKLRVGAHVSAAGGVHNAILNSVQIGGNAMGLFLKSQRKWENPPLKEEHCQHFLSHCREHKYNGDSEGETRGKNNGDGVPPIVPHGSYLVNLAHTMDMRAKQAYDSFIDDLDRCRRLGIKLYNFHPGNSASSTSRAAAIKTLAGQMNRAHRDPKSGPVVTILETMAGGANTLGSTFEDLRDIIDLIDRKERVGVCLDTCHVFAAGYDITTPETLADTLEKFDKIVGLKYLMALHLNDSKAPLASGRDLHANIGTGFLGLRAFHALVNEPRLWGLPMVLETPIEVKDANGKEIQEKSIWANEIKLLESLVGMDTETEEFRMLENELAMKGSSERERIQDQVKRKDKKAAKEAAKKAAGKGKRKGKAEEVMAVGE